MSESTSNHSYRRPYTLDTVHYTQQPLMNPPFLYNSCDNNAPYANYPAYETLPGYMYQQATPQAQLHQSSQLLTSPTDGPAGPTRISTTAPPALNYHPSYYQQNEIIVKGSPSSLSSVGYSSPKTPPTTTFSQSIAAVNPVTHVMPSYSQSQLSLKTTFEQQPSLMVNPLPPFDPEQKEHGQQHQKSTEERVKETIARANTVPAEFFQTQFLQYQVDQKSSGHGLKRKRTGNNDGVDKLNGKEAGISKDGFKDRQLSTRELRRQVHIQSEQKRRAQIKDGFEELKIHLPGCANKKLSKAALLTRTVQQLEHMKKMQNELLLEVERLMEENSSLKRYATVIQQH